MRTKLNVLFLAAEAYPFVKVGGLGDVAGALPIAIRNSLSPGDMETQYPAVDIRLVIPLHGVIQRKGYELSRVAMFDIPYRDDAIRTEVLYCEYQGLPVYLITGSPIPSEAQVYSTDIGVDGNKYTYFSLAALEMTRHINFIPDVVHANDWHTAPAVYALNLWQEQRADFQQASTMITIHNLPFLGVGSGPALAAFGLPPASNSALPTWAQDLPLPLALLTADQIVAVSPNYARQILTPEYGAGLEKFLRTRKDATVGILNGIDTKNNDPQNDPVLAMHYNSQHLEDRTANKIALQQELDLEPDTEKILFGLISRLDIQKGIDLLPDALKLIDDMDWQLVLLGTGDPSLEDALRQLEADYPGRVRAVIRFDMLLSRKINAGADVLLIPSRYEPCGLTQMVAMRYGCIPIARATGGLVDTIKDARDQVKGTGFLFGAASSEALAEAMRRALHAFQQPKMWRKLQHNAMAQDFSWERSAREYIHLYQKIIHNRTGSEL